MAVVVMAKAKTTPTLMTYLAYLEKWDKEVWPVFSHYSISKDTALLFCALDKIGNVSGGYGT